MIGSEASMLRFSCLWIALSAVSAAPRSDWLLHPPTAHAAVEASGDGREVSLANGLIRRTWRLKPDCATAAFENLTNGASMIRGVKPEAILTLDGVETPVGGLLGQPDYAYLLPQWLDSMSADPRALHCTGWERAPVEPRFGWKRVRYAAATQWPPPGAGIVFHYGAAAGLRVDVHYEMYDGVPVLAKWFTLRNEGGRAVRLNRFTSEVLAVVEEESSVEMETRPPQSLYVESDYTFGGTANRTTVWSPDPQYTSQVNYRLLSPLLLESRPPVGPNIAIPPGGRFESFRTFLLALDSTDRERTSLARRRMYRTIAPWTTENPILMHARSSTPDAVKLAIDQSAAVGFEMVILSFGSGFNAENEDPAYLAQLRSLAEYARSKHVELGGYSLLASRKISAEDDAINPKTGKPGGAIFENSPCLVRKLRALFAATGFAVLEHDGSYPGDVCASTTHPGHEGLEDSQWRQFEAIRDFYHWCREQGIYLNVPDWYFLNGSNKTAMGYRETNWSLPRERQFVLGRQNIFDGTWDKPPSMGWMFVPLVQYHGGGDAATLEPLKDHLDAYEQHLAQNFGSGVQACYRGPRLYDSPETEAVVRRWVDFYKAHRAILDSDVIHLRRPDGRDWDGLLHVNPQLEEKGMAVLFNPLDRAIERRVGLPLYYTGLTATAAVRIDGGALKRYPLDRDYGIEVPVRIPARGWVRIEIR
jgi:hypothetical protein